MLVARLGELVLAAAIIRVQSRIFTSIVTGIPLGSVDLQSRPLATRARATLETSSKGYRARYHTGAGVWTRHATPRRVLALELASNEEH